jgi:hypothetical protein
MWTAPIYVFGYKNLWKFLVRKWKHLHLQRSRFSILVVVARYTTIYLHLKWIDNIDFKTVLNHPFYVKYTANRHNTIINIWSVRDARDRMVVGFTTTYAISAYHHWCYEFESRSGRGVHHYVIKCVSDLRQVGGFLRVLQFPPPIKLTATI